MRTRRLAKRTQWKRALSSRVMGVCPQAGNGHHKDSRKGLGPAHGFSLSYSRQTKFEIPGGIGPRSFAACYASLKPSYAAPRALSYRQEAISHCLRRFGRAFVSVRASAIAGAQSIGAALAAGAQRRRNRRRTDGHPIGVIPHRDRCPHCRVAGRVDHRNIAGEKIRDIGVFPIRRDGDPRGVSPPGGR